MGKQYKQKLIVAERKGNEGLYVGNTLSFKFLAFFWLFFKFCRKGSMLQVLKCRQFQAVQLFHWESPFRAIPPTPTYSSRLFSRKCFQTLPLLPPTHTQMECSLCSSSLPHQLVHLCLPTGCGPPCAERLCCLGTEPSAEPTRGRGSEDIMK